MSDLSTFDELSPLLETQAWAVYQTQTRLFFKIGGWQKTPHLFEDERTAQAAYACLSQNDYPHAIIIAFNVSPSHAIVPQDSKASNLIEDYVAQRQAKTIEQNLPTKSSKTKSKL